MGLLDGKSAIITGSARGIGRATAELFVSEGAQVLINDIDGDVAEQAASEIDGETAVFSGDLTKPGVPDELVKKALDDFGKVDIVVNNAGYTWDGVVHKMTDEQFQAMLDIHTIVPFRVTRAIAPDLARGRQGRDRRGQGGLPQDHQHSARSRGRWATPARSTTRPRRPASSASPRPWRRSGASSRSTCNAVAFGFIETRLTQAKEKGEKIEMPDGE